MLNLLRSGQDDPEMAEIAGRMRAKSYDLFVEGRKKRGAEYHFEGSMIGLNKDILLPIC